MNVAALQITDEDIDRLEQRWSRDLARPVRFSEERHRVLKHMGTCDVQACPGSGKTTTLTAKLELLLEKWPESLQGICVLSHTNAARDEVVSKLGRIGERLLHRPHFIGTIQHFINHFLATPEAIERFGTRPWAFDDAAHYIVMRRKLADLPYRRRSYYDRESRVDDGAFHLSTLTLSFEDPSIVRHWKDNKESDIRFGSTTDTHQELKRLKLEVAADGCFSFHDAYSLGNAYISRYPEVSNILARRFPIVFIDEMQDTDQYQIELLRKIYDGKAVVQRFGDRNQSIFSNSPSDAEVENPWESDISLEISTTHRLSSSISTLAERMGLHQQTLTSESETVHLPHTIFVFSNPRNVLPAYAQLIAENNLSGKGCKAVAAVGTPQSVDLRFTLQSYLPTYSGSQQRSRQTSFQAFWDEAARLYQDYGYAGRAYDTLFAALVQISRELQIRRPNDPYNRFHSLSSLRKALLPQRKAARSILLKWLRLIALGQQPTAQEVCADAVALLFPADQRPTSLTKVRKFLSNTEHASADKLADDSNTFITTIDGQEIRVDLGTIHSVKGQTHRATLLMESYWYGADLEDLKPYLLNERPNRSPKIRSAKRLKLAYVAMTRPTHLLCLAIHTSRLSKEEKEKLTQLGWSIAIID